MRKLLLSAAALAAIVVSPAFAADLPARPVYKAPAPLAPVYNWSGFYIGGNVGYLVQSDYSAASSYSEPGLVINAPIANAAATAFTGGGQIGINWQVAPQWVFGVEADWNWTNPSNSFCRTTTIGPPCTDAGTGVLAISEKTEWLASVRGRLGLVWNNVLFYGTGGGAWGRVETNLVANCAVAGCGNNFGLANVTSASFSTTKGGWVAGLGAEAMLTPNWTARAEWLHYDLGNVTATLAAPVAVGSYGVTYSRSLSYDTIRLGLNYKFGWGAGAY